MKILQKNFLKPTHKRFALWGALGLILLILLGIGAYLFFSRKNNDEAALLSRIKNLEASIAAALENARQQKNIGTEKNKKALERLEGLAKQMKQLKQAQDNAGAQQAQNKGVSGACTDNNSMNSQLEDVSHNENSSQPAGKRDDAALSDAEVELSDILNDLTVADDGAYAGQVDSGNPNFHASTEGDDHQSPGKQAAPQNDGNNTQPMIVINPTKRGSSTDNDSDWQDPVEKFSQKNGEPVKIKSIKQAAQVVDRKIAYDVKTNCREMIVEKMKTIFAEELSKLSASTR